MSTQVRASLNFEGIDKPRAQARSEPTQRRAIDHASGFPSREPAEGQINIKGPSSEIARFRSIAKRDGLRLIGLLSRALDAYEEGRGHG